WVCAQNGWPAFTVEQYKHMVGNGIPTLVERFSPADCRSPEQPAATLAQFTARYAAHKQDKTDPYPGIPKLLAALKTQGTQTPVPPCLWATATWTSPPATTPACRPWARCGASAARTSCRPPARTSWSGSRGIFWIMSARQIVK